MSNAYFSANKSLKGAALFLTWNSKEGNVFWGFCPQIAFDPKNQSQNFDWKNKINVKLTQDEAADIVRAVRTNGVSKFYHEFDSKVTTGSFGYYNVDVDKNDPSKGKRQGFRLVVKKGEQEVMVGFSLGAAERFSLVHQHALTHIFDSEYGADVVKSKEYAKKKEESAKKSPPKVEKAPEPVESEEPTEESGPEIDLF